MKSLSKSLDILEYIFLNGDRCIRPLELSQALGLSSPTCVRILQDFVSRGYLEQPSRTAGYRPGPMISSLFCRSNIYSRLVEGSRLPLQQLSSRLQMQVNLAVMHSSGRIMLYYCGISNPWPRFRFQDHEETATGRLLQAALFPDRNSGEHPSISPAWEDPLNSEDESIRFAGEGGMEIQGFLIRQPDYPLCAFGYGVPAGIDAEEIYCVAKKLRSEICQNLRIHYQSF